jgi:5,10-methylene-tetrahydrofolate dehydrogenase/methenyl tetrahydrofolate cyclohydrolase
VRRALAAEAARRASRLDGRLVASQIQSELKRAVALMREETGQVPGLAVILVGDRKESRAYVEKKKRLAASLGFLSLSAHLSTNSSQADVERAISNFNRDPSIHGILVQLPLPSHLDTAHVLAQIAAEKDVDGFHPLNVGLLALDANGERYSPWERRYEGGDGGGVGGGGSAAGAESRFTMSANSLANLPAPHNFIAGGRVACTAKAVMEILARYKVELAGKHAVVLGRSSIVGMPLSLSLLSARTTVTNVHASHPDIASVTRQADVLVAAVGQRELVRASWVKPGAVVIDVGIHYLGDGRVVGDVCAEEVEAVAGALTPVPGGVGPVTVAMLMSNTFNNARTLLDLAASAAAVAQREPPSL